MVVARTSGANCLSPDAFGSDSSGPIIYPVHSKLTED
jgi:hypothetical protein